MPNSTLIYSNIASINKEYIILVNKDSQMCIDFKECAKNYASEKHLETSKCVATRDITALTFVFYSKPKATIVFKKKSIFSTLFTGKSAIKQFLELQNTINSYGFSTYDLS